MYLIITNYNKTSVKLATRNSHKFGTNLNYHKKWYRTHSLETPFSHPPSGYLLVITIKLSAVLYNRTALKTCQIDLNLYKNA